MNNNAQSENQNGIKKLHLSSADKKLLGVCGGVGEYFSIDSTLVRLAWIVITIMTAIVPGVIGYFVAALIIPQIPNQEVK